MKSKIHEPIFLTAIFNGLSSQEINEEINHLLILHHCATRTQFPCLAAKYIWSIMQLPFLNTSYKAILKWKVSVLLNLLLIYQKYLLYKLVVTMCKAEGFPENHSRTNKNSIFKSQLPRISCLILFILYIHQAMVSVAQYPRPLKIHSNQITIFMITLLKIDLVIL